MTTMMMASAMCRVATATATVAMRPMGRMVTTTTSTTAPVRSPLVSQLTRSLHMLSFLPSRWPSLTTTATHNSSLRSSTAITLTATSTAASTTTTSNLLSSPLVRTIKYVARKKMKSHSGSKKRFRITRTGKIMRWRAGKQHNNSHKRHNRLSRLRKPVPVYAGHVKMILRSLPYGRKHAW